MPLATDPEEKYDNNNNEQLRHCVCVFYCFVVTRRSKIEKLYDNMR